MVTGREYITKAISKENLREKDVGPRRHITGSKVVPRAFTQESQKPGVIFENAGIRGWGRDRIVRCKQGEVPEVF